MPFLPVLLAAILLFLAACTANDRSTAPPGSGGDGWQAAWGTANYTTFPNGPLTQEGFSPSTGNFTDNEAVAQSFRMMVHPSTGGERLRLQFSNVFGDRPLALRSVSVALRAAASGPAIDAASRVPVLFGGAAEVSVPAGAEIVSDAAELAWSFGDDLAVSFHVPGPSGPMSWHAEAFATQYISPPGSGDVTGDAAGTGFSNVERGWFFLSGLDTRPADPAPWSIVAFGDSITDGFAGTPELNHRYPDFLASRLQAEGIAAGVVNAGINSNRVLDGGVTEGAAGIVRFERDVLRRSGAGAVFILLGTNDLSAGRSAEEVYAGLVELAGQAHAAGVCTLVSTILPRNDPPFPFGWDAATEEPERVALNQMILAGTDFDAVADVAAAMENPLVPGQPMQVYFVEGLHPNSAGMQVLADAIPLEPLLPPPLGSCQR